MDLIEPAAPAQVRKWPFSDVALVLGEVCFKGNSGRALPQLRSRLLTHRCRLAGANFR